MCPAFFVVSYPVFIGSRAVVETGDTETINECLWYKTKNKNNY